MAESRVDIVVVFGKNRFVIGIEIGVGAPRESVLYRSGEGRQTAEGMNLAYLGDERPPAAVDVHDIRFILPVGIDIGVVAAVVA